jgi:hypothetical protein
LKNISSLVSFLVPIIGLEPIQMQMSGGHLLPPVQKLVASSVFTFGENESRPGHRHQFPHF